MKDSKPFISVVIPTYNRENTIKDSLKSLKEVDYPDESYEIIVSDDGSTDRTVELAREFEDVKIVESENTGPAGARNRGVNEASQESDIVLFIDGDSRADTDLLKEHAEMYETNNEKIIVSGAVELLEEEQNYQSKILDLSNFFPKKGGEEDSLNWAQTNNLSFPINIFDKIKFDEDFKRAAGEDQNMCIRSRELGYRIIQNDDAKVYHPPDKTIWAGISRSYKYGEGNSPLVEKHSDISIISPRIIGRFIVYFATFFFIGSALFGRISLLEMGLKIATIIGVGSFFFFKEALYDFEAYNQGFIFLLILSITRYFLMEALILGKIVEDIKKLRPTILREIEVEEMLNFPNGLYYNRFLGDFIAVLIAIFLI